MTARTVVQETVDEYFHERGLVRRSGCWYEPHEQVIGVNQLQKSQYSARYYLNVSMWITQLGVATFPKEALCHVRLRADDIVGAHAARLERLLNLDADVGTDRRGALKGLLEEALTPFLDMATSVNGLRDLRRSGALRAALISGPATELLDASD